MRISDWSSDVCSSDLDVAALQGLDRQQAVVDRAERGVGADDDGDLPSGEQVGVEGGGRYRNERAAGTFDDQVPGRRDQDFDVDVDTVNFGGAMRRGGGGERSEEHTSELQSLMRISSAVFCLKKKNR